MSFLCTTINKEVDCDYCKNKCQYVFKEFCIDKINAGYNQALEDLCGVAKEEKQYAD